MKIEDAIEGLRLQLEYFDEECRYDASIEGGESEHWDELEVSAEAVRVLLKHLKGAPLMIEEPSLDLLQSMYEAMFADKWDCTQAVMVGAGYDAARKALQTK